MSSFVLGKAWLGGWGICYFLQHFLSTPEREKKKEREGEEREEGEEDAERGKEQGKEEVNLFFPNRNSEEFRQRKFSSYQHIENNPSPIGIISGNIFTNILPTYSGSQLLIVFLSE